MTEAAPLPSARALRTRGALMAAGLELLKARSIDAIAIDEIVATAGVGKGSFFNHFADKQAFAAQIAGAIRIDLEAQVAAANIGETDPAVRMARGMRTSVAFALAKPDQTRVMLRTLGQAMEPDHPLNAGVRRDVQAALADGTAHHEATRAGVLYWVGLCQALMADVTHRGLSAEECAAELEAMLTLGLLGMGVGPDSARMIAAAEAQQLRAASQMAGS